MSVISRRSIKVPFVALLIVVFGFALAGCSSDLRESDINDLYAHPEDYKGRRIANLTMQVVGVDKKDGEVQLRAFENIRKTEHPTLVIVKDADVDYQEYEFIKVKGKVAGKVKVKDESGSSVTAVQIQAEKISKIKSTDAFPAEDTVRVDSMIKKNGVTATIKKIDFTKESTRVYLSIKNGTDKRVEVYPDQSLIEQDSKDYEADMGNYFYEDVQLSNTVKAGETITGVVVFERIDPNLPFTFAFEGADHKHSEFEISFNFAKQ